MLWLMTLIGLVFGAGYLWFGAAITALAFAVVWGLRLVEGLIAQDHRSALVIDAETDSLTDAEMRRLVVEAGMRVLVWSVTYLDEGRRRVVTCDLGWH